jgi:hypothetical protein
MLSTIQTGQHGLKVLRVAVSTMTGVGVLEVSAMAACQHLLSRADPSISAVLAQLDAATTEMLQGEPNQHGHLFRLATHRLLVLSMRCWWRHHVRWYRGLVRALLEG